MNSKTRIIGIVTAMILLTAGIIGFIIIPTISQIRMISQSIYDERVDLERKYERGQLLRNTLETFELLKPQRQLLDSVFITEGNELELITTLETIASRNGVDQRLDLGPIIVQHAGSNARTLGISVQGDFGRILNYLLDLEKLNFYYNSTNFIIAAGEVNRDIGRIVNVNLDGYVYISSVKDNLSDESSELPTVESVLESIREPVATSTAETQLTPTEEPTGDSLPPSEEPTSLPDQNVS